MQSEIKKTMALQKTMVLANKFDPARLVTAALVAVLLSGYGPCQAQDAPIKVTVTSARAVVYRFQDARLRVTIENTGANPTAPLKREDILGARNFLCAKAAYAASDRSGEWATPVGPQMKGTIGPLLPGESFMTSVEVALPPSLATTETAVSIQWVGKIGKQADLRSAEIQINLRDGKFPIALIDTSAGEIVAELWSDKAPNHVCNFIQLARKGFYNKLTFHRVFPNFIIQTGSPDGTDEGGPGYTIPFEKSEAKFSKGVLGMAILGEKQDTGGSQWFACIADAHTLNDKYTAFGKILEGQDKADAIGRSPTSKPGRPTQPAVIRGIKVLTPKTYVLPKLVKNDAGDRSKKDGK